MTLTIVDSEAVVRTWARSNTTIRAAISDRTFFATPQPYEKSSPSSWAVMFLVSEVQDDSDASLQSALVQFTVFGKTKVLASTAARAIQQAGQQLQFGPPVRVDGAVIQIGSVSQLRWLPDPTTNLARYDVDLRFLIRGGEAV